MATTISSREFNQDLGKAKRASNKGPVFITDRGKPAHVLMSMEHYKRLSGGGRNIVEMLAMPSDEDIELPIPDFKDIGQGADLDDNS